MAKEKSLQELTIKDNFMFGAVMSEPENCKRLLEMVLGIKISNLHIDREKSFIYHPEYHGIRLDVYADDKYNTHYNVEMQARECKSIKLRSRYYHSQMDMELLDKGMDYEKLPNSYVLFICDYDPFEERKYVYTQKICVESTNVDMDDGIRTIYLSTQGENRDEISVELVKFLEFVGKPLEESEQEIEDVYVRQLQDSVRRVKADREMGARYMTLKQLIMDERKEAAEEALAIGRAEGEHTKLLTQVQKKLAKGHNAIQIAEALEETTETIEQLIKQI